MMIGILGGSFNPLHNGHLALAQAAYDQLQLDEVWFAPSGNHPLKREKLLPLEERLDLLEQALDNFPDFRISLADTDSDKPSYSDQLVNKFLKKYPEHDFFFLVGQDILSELHNWHNYRWLLDHVKLCVFTRMGNFPEHHLTNEEYNKIICLTMPPVDISATEIREKVRRGEEISGLVPDAILDKTIQALKKQSN